MNQNLPWLKQADRESFFARLVEIAKAELVSRHWGTVKTKGTGPYGHPTLYVLDMRGLLLITGAMRYLLRSSGTALFYRGSTRHHRHLTPSLYRTSGQLTKSERQLREARLVKQLHTVAGVFDVKPTAPDEREALAQHYGLATRCLDLVDHVQTAAWFAYCRESLEETEREDAVGHIYALAADQKGQWSRAIDLRVVPSNWLRPHMQQAVMLFPGKKAANQTDFDYACAAHFIVPRPLLRMWSSFDRVGRDVMFPPTTQDQGAYYFSRAVEELDAAGLLDGVIT